MLVVCRNGFHLGSNSGFDGISDGDDCECAFVSGGDNDGVDDDEC